MAKYCALCQEKQGMLSLNSKTNDGYVICINCAAARGLTCISKLDDGRPYTAPDHEKIMSMTLDQVRDYISPEAQAQADALESIIVTTTDIDAPYKVLSPVFFQVSNKGAFSSDFDNLSSYYKQQREQSKPSSSSPVREHIDLGPLWNQTTVSQGKWEEAFYISVEELKKRAYSIGADAIVGMKMDIDLDTNALQFFYMQMYGTAVKLEG